MTVKKKVNALMDSFIDKGASVKSNKDRDFKNVLIRIPQKILTEIDELLEKKPWLNRTQLIVEAIHEKLKRDSDDEKENIGC